MLREPKSLRVAQPKKVKLIEHPDCATYTRFPRSEGQSTTVLHLDFEGLSLGKLRMIAIRMLNLNTGKTDWSEIHDPLAKKLRTVVGSGQCSNITSTDLSLSILFTVRGDAINDVSQQLKEYFSTFGIVVGIFP